MTIFMTWNLHDWSANREPAQQARSSLMSVLQGNRVEVAILNEIRNLDDLVRLVGRDYHVVASTRLVYANAAMLAQPKWTIKQARAQGHTSFFSEYYVVLVHRDSGISCEPGGLISINPPIVDSERRSTRLAAPVDFTEDQLDGERVLVCRVYRPAWHWRIYHGDLKAIDIVGVHTKPIGSKESARPISTLAQTVAAASYASESFPSGQWLVCGDFYAHPRELASALQHGGHACSILAPAENTNHPHSGAGCVADYFVVGPDLRAYPSAQRIDITQLPSTTGQYSDHDPVLIKVAWP